MSEKFYIGLKGSLQIGFTLFKVILHRPFRSSDIKPLVTLLQTHLLEPIMLNQTTLQMSDVVIQLQKMLGETATITMTDRLEQYGDEEVFRQIGSDYHLMFSVWLQDIQEYGHVEVYDDMDYVERLFRQGGIIKN